ncbi:hypothetical protein Pint_22184 [Pistacia integerrima]|uniref:Uncharacterized protein n=1 Tax=Pistacia integerrima TaxID=434235 RepID=A0ACC0YPQ5_9ROSI|nr:hypothetical protein Pint_22184 [Pistacia integerrima]
MEEGEEGTEKKVSATTGFIAGQLMMFISIYYAPLHLALDLEWKLIYVGSAEDETYDQLLESVLVGPVNVGNYRFVLQAILDHTFACS